MADGMSARGWRTAFAVAPGTPEAAAALPRSQHEFRILEDPTPETLAASWPEGAELLVVDHYDLDACWERANRPWARRILAIDDLANRPHDADILLDQTFGRAAEEYRGLVGPDCRIFTGSTHALLRPVFAAAQPAALARRVLLPAEPRVLVAMGMSDPDDATGLVLDGIAASGLPLRVDVVLGSGAPHVERVRARTTSMPQPARLLCDVTDMAGLMVEADLAVGAGGTTSWERCCLGLPGLVIVTANNQERIAHELDAAGAIQMLGRHPSVPASAVAEALSVLVHDDQARIAMSRAATALCDGLGCERLLEDLERSLR
ncbi:UDP-2,4-diacetamido-2,4,6-trideoxy-beta-L-altropyranose hydrolase [Azospirillum soli]|nr:UDP-2,4-diacetamido-2,4,6-trideoxy-beta-L-altropyranose hydrolase [Azospirillum soli]